MIKINDIEYADYYYPIAGYGIYLPNLNLKEEIYDRFMEYDSELIENHIDNGDSVLTIQRDCDDGDFGYYIGTFSAASAIAMNHDEERIKTELVKLLAPIVTDTKQDIRDACGYYMIVASNRP